MYKIRLENTITHQIYEQQVEDGNNGETLYFRFGISTFDLADGEYILTLFDAEGNVLAEDLLRIGDYNPETLQYTKGEKTYLDVTVEGLIQKEVTVVLDTVNGRGIPDLGYDAVETVWINAQPLYDSARAEGYDEGYGLGLAESYPKGYEDGYNKGTEDGFVAGSEDAYPKGYESGYDVGKTDGYNEGYDVGSTDMYIEMLEETRVLNVTENGRYITKYTEDPYIPTGDGDFANFCKLTNTTYKMGRLKSRYEADATGGDVIEFWWKPKDLAYNHRPMILMSSLEDDGNGIHHTFSINLLTYDREDKLRFRSDAGGGTFVEYIIDNPEMWYHILYDKGNIYINDEFVGTLGIVNDTETSYIYLNGDTRNDTEDGIDECNGYFGMVKVNGDVFVPTENGYVYQNNGTITQPIEDGEYEFFLQKDPEGGLYRTVNVNIDTKQYFLDGYDEGYELGVSESYPTGYEDGYGNGRTDGINEQKDKLTQITISENGVYTNENGYNEVVVEVADLNGDYNEGYEQGHTDGYNEGYSVGSKEGVEGYANNTARVLDITENGTYGSEYSEPYYISDPTGDNFYDSAFVKDRVYDTQIPLSQDVTFEIWFKPEGIIDDDGFGAILGASKQDTYYKDLWLRHRHSGDIDDYEFRYGYYSCYFKLKLNSLNHIALKKHPSGDDGFVFLVNEVVVGEFSKQNELGQITSNTNIYINGSETTQDGRTDDGVYGMIKINDVVIIPTESGFKRLDNGEVLPPIYEGGSYTYQQGELFYPSGPLYKTVNVNVQPKIDVEKTKIKFGHSTFTTLPEWADFTNVTDMYYMFYNCTSLTTIPILDTSNVISMERMFSNCTNLTTIPQLYTSNVISMSYMFYACNNLTIIPMLDTSNVTSMTYMFYNCRNLTSIPQLYTSKVTNMSYMFYGCTNLTTIPELDTSKVTNMGNYFRQGGGSLTDVGGWKNLNINWNDNYGLVLCPNLTYQSCINILNGLANVTELGSRTLKVHQNFINNVGDDITIGTNKGWTITT